LGWGFFLGLTGKGFIDFLQLFENTGILKHTLVIYLLFTSVFSLVANF